MANRVMAKAKKTQKSEAGLFSLNRLGGFLLMALGIVTLIVSGFFVWGRVQANFTRENMMRNVELTEAELANEVRRVYNLLASPPVIALATKAANGEAGAEQAVRDLVQTQIPNILVLKVLPGEIEKIETGTPPKPGFAVLDMAYVAEEYGAAPAQVHFVGADRENLSFMQSVNTTEGISAYIWLSVPTSMLTNQFKDYGIGSQYLALEQVTLRHGAMVLKSFGRTPSNTELEIVPIEGSMLRMVWYASAPLSVVRTRDLGLGFALGVLLIIGGFLMLRRTKVVPEADDSQLPATEKSRLLEEVAASVAAAAEERQRAESQKAAALQPAPAEPPKPTSLAEAAGAEESYSPTPIPQSSNLPMDTELLLHPGIFRAYDIRGVVGRTLDASTARAIGRAVASEAKEKGGTQVVVARDGRLSGPELLAAVTDGILEAGCDVLDIGAVPTPVLYFAVHELGAGSGVMVTGSHNPPEYNGFKIMINGQTLAGEEIQALRKRIENNNFTSGNGRLIDHNVLDMYTQRIGTDIQIERPLKVVVDCGNGIAGVIAPRVLQAIGAHVTPLYADVDGTFPNHHPDPSVPSNLMDLKLCVRNFNADLGFAFDGDGDRLGVVVPSGEIIWPDQLMVLFARDVLKRNAGASIIYDVKCSGRLATAIRESGGDPVMWRTGHSLIKRKMQELSAPLAGEMSGHFFFKERWYGFDDGIYAACRLLEILALDSRPPAEVLLELTGAASTPEIKVPMKEGRSQQFIDEFRRRAQFDGADISTIDGLRADYPDGFGLVRASNTTPVLVLRFEADDDQALQRIQKQFREQLLEVNPYLELPF